VTGASVGIGRGIALALAAEGVKWRSRRAARTGCRNWPPRSSAAGGREPVLIEQDMYAEDAARRLAEAAIAGLGRVDILVNNAGGSRAASRTCTSARSSGRKRSR
jgi:3-oxoacyl-[acyl-carrier protein] reductase